MVFVEIGGNLGSAMQAMDARMFTLKINVEFPPAAKAVVRDLIVQVALRKRIAKARARARMIAVHL